MAEHRHRRRFQFGILDVLILTTIVAVVLVLCQPVKVVVATARPWVAGSWWNGSAQLLLFPDGYYAYLPQQLPEDRAAGVGWTVSQDTAGETFVLTCGELRFLIRHDDSRDVLEPLTDDGSGVPSPFERESRMQGPVSFGAPHGTWSWVIIKPPALEPGPALLLEYRHGELVDLHDSTGRRELDTLNALRSGRGLPALAQGDFPVEPAAEDPTP